MNKIFFYSITLLLLFVVILPQQTSAGSKIIFQDNFNNETTGSFPSKWILSNDPNNTPCNAEWRVVNKNVGIIIANQYFCTTNITPKDDFWLDPGNKYSIKTDITLESGTDHNFAFGFIQEDGMSKFYEVHFQAPYDFILDGLSDGILNYNLSKNYPYNTYTLEIKVTDNNIKIYVDQILVRDFTATDSELRKGKIALRAGAGADTNAITYYDNIVVTEINDDPVLDVPLLMQVEQEWSNDPYDHIDTTIGESGCAMVSAAMILKYHRIHVLPNGLILNPRTLNQWLINYYDEGGNGGYLRNGSINWQAISALSKNPQTQLRNPLFEKDGLELSWPENPTDIDVITDLEDGLPVIMHVNAESHFVVATGVENETFLINDPLYSEPKKLTDNYNGAYQSIRRYVPSDTDVSYLVLAIEDYIDITVKDNGGKEVGIQQIEQPVKNTNGKTEFVNYPLKTVYIPKPETGEYIISLSSNGPKAYLLDIYTYDIEGTLNKNNIKGFVHDQQDRIIINFDKENVENSNNSKNVTFQSTMGDVEEAIALKLINRGIGESIINHLQSAEKELKGNNRISIFIAKKRLDMVEKLLNNLPKRKGILEEEAYQILKYDIEQLKLNLNS